MKRKPRLVTWKHAVRDYCRKPGETWHALLAATLCARGHHCPPEKGIRKFDGGRCPLLCCHCRTIIGHW